MPPKLAAKKAPARKPAARTRKKAASRHWIVVTDHRKAHVYQKTPRGISRLPEECLHCSLPAPEGGADDTVFLQNLADWLCGAVEEGSFNRLAIIADPASLKSIHPMLDKKVHACVCATLAKDVKEISDDEIEDHLADVVWL